MRGGGGGGGGVGEEGGRGVSLCEINNVGKKSLLPQLQFQIQYRANLAKLWGRMLRVDIALTSFHLFCQSFQLSNALDRLPINTVKSVAFDHNCNAVSDHQLFL